MKVSLNINFSIVNQYNCYQICYRNSNFITLSRNVWSKSNFDQILGKRDSQTRQVFNFMGV